MRKFLTLSFCLICTFIYSQDSKNRVTGKVESESSKTSLQNVHVLNLSKVVGTITDEEGVFEINASVNDTLYFSYIGYKPLKIIVTNDLIKYEDNDLTFNLTELALALEEVIITPYRLTGYLEIDVKNAPINSSPRYRIIGLPNLGYEGGRRTRSGISKLLGALFNPGDFLNSLFKRNPKKMAKLRLMREDEQIKILLSTKFDREVLVQLLGIPKIDINEILRNCSFSDTFIKEANDPQIMEAINECYDEYKLLEF